MVRPVSAVEMVRMGLTGNNSTHTCQCLVERYLDFRKKQVDGNNVPFLTALGMNWFSRCRGSEENFWDQEGIATAPCKRVQAIGLPASMEWKRLRQFVDDAENGPLVIVCLQRCATVAGVGVPYSVKWKFGNAYSIIHNEEQLFSLYRQLPPGDRYVTL